MNMESEFLCQTASVVPLIFKGVPSLLSALDTKLDVGLVTELRVQPDN